MTSAPRGPLSTKPRTTKQKQRQRQKPSAATKPSTAEVPADPPATLPAKAAPSGQVSTKRRPAKAKPSAATKPSTGEVVPALLSKDELRPMINKARKYGREFEETGKLWAVELRRLQDAKAHLTYGRESFGAWAASEFADIGLTPANANKLSQMGRVILLLQSKGRVDLADPGTLPGATGARALTSVMAKHGEDAMLQIFDAVPADSVVANTVKAAAGALLPPPPPAAGRAGHQSSIDHEDDPEEPEEIPKPVQNLRDHVERIRDLLDELYLADDIDPVAAARAYEHLLEDTQALRPVLDAVLPVEGDVRSHRE